MNITLIGFMGTGKTAVGKRLAKRLSWRFVDVDQLVEASAKMSVARIFAERGEAVFRRLESRCIARVVREREQVIATGGGAFLDARNRSRLRASGPVIGLTARARTLLARVGPRLETRPLLRGNGGDALARIKTLLTQRERAYAKADLTVDTSDLSVEEVVERIWAHLSPCLCKSWRYLLDHSEELARRYGGKYIVVVEDRIVASGETQLEAYQKAHLRSLRETRSSAREQQARASASRAAEAPETGIYYIPLPEESLTALSAAA